MGPEKRPFQSLSCVADDFEDDFDYSGDPDDYDEDDDDDYDDDEDDDYDDDEDEDKKPRRKSTRK